ncbi:Probable protein S-acyltransferase 14 [Striga hermonthica]|uniref:S-acyltransferase n=1 Tax=Striga hermonthica TaxID=68872 RepID=A0A9N7N4A5_STRHE|nr:Probable protein S-acyltransferase 14 [Striga hermonthica]
MYRSGVVMAWNVFKFCTALRGLGSIMILLVLGVVGVSYYAVVITNYGPGLAVGGLDSLVAFFILILFHGLLVMLLWSYFSVVFTDPGSVPPNWRPAVDEERGDSDPLTATEFPADSENGRIRYCRKCNQLKPPRCHHCSVCGRCILKMDHHCVWVVNCVGALNYKYFLLFLFYTFLETSVVTLSLLPQFIAFFGDDKEVEMSLVNFAYEKKTSPKWRYDLGRKRNFEQVFGMDKKYWFLPAYTEEDIRRIPALQGLEYPSKPDLDSEEL